MTGFDEQLAMYKSSLAEAHAQDIEWSEIEEPWYLYVNVGPKPFEIGYSFDKQMAMWWTSMVETEQHDLVDYQHDHFTEQETMEREDFFNWRRTSRMWKFMSMRYECPTCYAAVGVMCINLSKDKRQGTTNTAPHVKRKGLANKAIRDWSYERADHRAKWHNEKVRAERLAWEREMEASIPVLVVGSAEEKEFSDKVVQEQEARREAWKRKTEEWEQKRKTYRRW